MTPLDRTCVTTNQRVSLGDEATPSGLAKADMGIAQISIACFWPLAGFIEFPADLRWASQFPMMRNPEKWEAIIAGRHSSNEGSGSPSIFQKQTRTPRSESSFSGIWTRTEFVFPSVVTWNWYRRRRGDQSISWSIPMSKSTEKRTRNSPRNLCFATKSNRLLPDVSSCRNVVPWL